MADLKVNTITAGLVCGAIVVCTMVLIIAMAAEAKGSPTPTVVANVSVTPTPTAPPTPAQRQVFSGPRWDNDHVSILVTNHGPAIRVETYIDTASNNNTITLGANTTTRVTTNTISAENGQIVNYGFKAYENDTLIDAEEGQVTVMAIPTTPPETAVLSGIVVDAATRAPIAGAEVILTSKTFSKQYLTIFTDKYGVFTSPKIYPDVYLITVKAGGYNPVINLETSQKVEGIVQLSEIAMDKAAALTPTPTPLPSATPGSPFDAWLALLYSPAACVATIGGSIGLLVSLTAIYEWVQRQKERRIGGQK